MAPVKIRASYYEQFDADHDLEVPSEGYGGWKTADVEIDPAHTALVVMHAWDCGTREEFPGWWKACGEIPNTYEICRTVFPPMLSAARASGLTVFHVIADAPYGKTYPGYQRALDLAGEPTPWPDWIEQDETSLALKAFTRDHGFPGAHNRDDIARGWERVDFPAEAVPVGDEGIAAGSNQLFALCRDAGINHLVYAGFCIDWCLLTMPGGMADMKKHGLVCSVIREATHSVENKETARESMCKQIGLWRVAINFGLVFGLDDFIGAVSAKE